MKKTALCLALGLMAGISLPAQTVSFLNVGVSAWAVTTNNQGVSGKISGAGGPYTFGLYVGAPGAASNQLTLVATALSSSLGPGTFMASHDVTNGLAAAMGSGNTIALQIRGWSSAGGSSYEQAYEAALSNPNILLGASAIVSGLAPATGITPPTQLFGTGSGPYLTSGFVLTSLASTVSPAPEPSTLLLGCLSGVALLLYRRR